jgi:hypothetical protein
MATITYRFRNGTRSPKGVTVQDVLDDRDRVILEHGEASVELATRAVLADPDKYPALRAFGPPDMEVAFENAIADGVRYAFGAVERIRVISMPTATQPGREIRVRELPMVQSASGSLVYERFEVMAADRVKRNFYIDRCRRELKDLTDRLDEILAEIQELTI